MKKLPIRPSLLIILLGLIFSTSAVYAESEIFRFQLDPQAKILHQSSEYASDYIVALDKYKKRDNQWLPEKSLRQQGQLLRYTVELPRHYTEEEAFAFYRNQLPASATLAFGCQQRACGESNNWANDHFGVKQLYGANNSQRYGVLTFKSSPDAAPTYITIYIVRRGNQRLYAQLDVLYASQP
jgi:hypothetical protein